MRFSRKAVSPSPQNVLKLRQHLGISQSKAAELASLGHGQRWSDYETGVKPMPYWRWELVFIRTGKHPDFETVGGVIRLRDAFQGPAD